MRNTDCKDVCKASMLAQFLVITLVLVWPYLRFSLESRQSCRALKKCRSVKLNTLSINIYRLMKLTGKTHKCEVVLTKGKRCTVFPTIQTLFSERGNLFKELPDGAAVCFRNMQQKPES